MMKRIAALLLVLLLLAGTALADQTVKLEDTRYTLALPDEMVTLFVMELLSLQVRLLPSNALRMTQKKSAQAMSVVSVLKTGRISWLVINSKYSKL